MQTTAAERYGLAALETPAEILAWADGLLDNRMTEHAAQIGGAALDAGATLDHAVKIMNQYLPTLRIWRREARCEIRLAVLRAITAGGVARPAGQAAGTGSECGSMPAPAATLQP